MKFWLEYLSPNIRENQAVFLSALVLLILAALLVLFSPLKAAAVAVSFIAFIIAIYRPFWLIYFLIIWTPFEPFLLKFAPDEIYVFARFFPEALIYLLLVLVVVHYIFERRQLPSTSIDLPFVLFIFVAIASALINLVDFQIAVLGLRQIIRFMVLFFVVVYLWPEKREIRLTVLLLLGLVFFESLLGLFQSLSGGALDEFLIPSERKFFESIQLTAGTRQFWTPGQRIFATMGRYDQLGTFLTFFLLILIGIVYEAKRHVEHRFFGFLLAVALPALTLTYSRASWFGLILGFLLIGLILKRDKKVAIGLAAFLIFVVSYLAYSGIQVRYLRETPSLTLAERFFETFSYERFRGEYLALGRVFWFVTTPTKVIPISPLFGFGPGQYGGGAVTALDNTAVYSKLGLPFGIHGTEGYIDNNWFSIWGETGTLGLIFYFWMFIALFITAYQSWKKSKDPWTRGLSLGFMGALLAVSFQAFLGTYLEVRTLALYLWLMAAYIVVLSQREAIKI